MTGPSHSRKEQQMIGIPVVRQVENDRPESHCECGCGRRLPAVIVRVDVPLRTVGGCRLVTPWRFALVDHLARYAARQRPAFEAFALLTVELEQVAA